MAAKGNSLQDMHDMLMEQMERLMDAESDEELEKEIKRSKSLSDVSKVIVDNTKNIIDANKIAFEYGINNKEVLQIEGGDK